MTNDVYKRNDIAYSAEINGKTVVLNTETEKFYNLDEIGGLIWQLFEKPSTIDDVVAGVSKECDVAVSECYNDIVAFINVLINNSLITLEVK